MNKTGMPHETDRVKEENSLNYIDHWQTTLNGDKNPESCWGQTQNMTHLEWSRQDLPGKCLGVMWKEHSKHWNPPDHLPEGRAWAGLRVRAQKASETAQVWKEGCAAQLQAAFHQKSNSLTQIITTFGGKQSINKYMRGTVGGIQDWFSETGRKENTLAKGHGQSMNSENLVF